MEVLIACLFHPVLFTFPTPSDPTLKRSATLRGPGVWARIAEGSPVELVVKWLALYKGLSTSWGLRGPIWNAALQGRERTDRAKVWPKGPGDFARAGEELGP